MADLSQYFSDHMFYDEKVYAPEVRRDGNGFYRWRYTMDKYHDRNMYRFLIKFWAIFALCGTVMGYLLAKAPARLMREDPDRYWNILTTRRILYPIACYAAFFAVGMAITGLIRLIEGGPSRNWYRMNDEFVQIRPSGKGSGINPFEEVKRVELYPSVNEIRLIGHWGKCPVLVRKEDYEMVKSHILSHIPAAAEIIEKEIRD